MFITAFIFGTLSAFFAVMLEIVALDTSRVHETTSVTLTLGTLITLLTIALIEEGSKYLFLRQHFLRSYATKSPTMNTVFALVLGFGGGFTAVEAAFIFSGGTPDNFLWLLGILFVHVATAFILTMFLKYPEKRSPGAFFLPLAFAILIHFCYDVFLSLSL